MACGKGLLPGCQAQRQGPQLPTARPVQTGAWDHCPRITKLPTWLRKPTQWPQQDAATE